MYVLFFVFVFLVSICIFNDLFTHLVSGVPRDLGRALWLSGGKTGSQEMADFISATDYWYDLEKSLNLSRPVSCSKK